MSRPTRDACVTRAGAIFAKALERIEREEGDHCEAFDAEQCDELSAAA